MLPCVSSEPAAGFGHSDQLGWGPLTLSAVYNERIVEVLAETAGALEQLAWRDLLGAVYQHTLPGIPRADRIMGDDALPGGARE